MKFDGKMRIDDQPFPQNMISFSVNMVSANDLKGKDKVKVLTSDRAKESGAVDLDRQVTSRSFSNEFGFRIAEPRKVKLPNPELHHVFC